MINLQSGVVIVCAKGPLAEKLLYEVAGPSRMPRKNPRNFEPHPGGNCPFDGKLFVGTIGLNGDRKEFILQCGGVMDGNLLLVEVDERHNFCFQLAGEEDPLFRQGVQVVKVNARVVTDEKIPDCATTFAAHLKSGKGITSRKPRGHGRQKNPRGHNGSFIGGLWDVEL